MGQCYTMDIVSSVDYGPRPAQHPTKYDAKQQRQRAALRSSFQEHLVREQEIDFHTIYSVVQNIGKGSISTISMIQRKRTAVGGSSRPSFVVANRQQHQQQQQQQQQQNRQALSVISPSSSKRRIKPTSSLPETTSSPTQLHQQGHFLALKEINLRHVHHARVNELRNELSLLKTLDHPHIIKAYESFLVDKRLAVVMEYCSGGDLWTRTPYRMDIRDGQSARIVRQVLSAVAYLHERSIVHRDIKFENILFENDTPESSVKLIDFGLARAYLDDPRLTQRCGTLYTMSPEVLREDYTSQADMWSVGVVAYMLCTGGVMPFYDESRAVMKNRIITGQFQHGHCWRHDVSNLAKGFICSLLALNPHTRLTAKQALRHRWLSKNTALVSSEKPIADVWKSAQANLIRYAEGSEFKKLALMVVARKSTAAEIIELRRCFDEIDKDHNGSVTFKEFRIALANMNYSEEEIKSIFDKMDLYGDGVIQYTEFLAATLEAQGHIGEYRIAEAFDLLDADDSGYISRENLQAMLGSEGTNDYVSNLIHELDTDGDGRVSYEEFKRAFDEAVETMGREGSEESIEC